MEVKGISQKIFRAKSNSVENNSKQTNPFGVRYGEKIISADVFDASFKGAKETLVQKAANKLSSAKNKLADAMKVGSINSFINKKVGAVVDFGKRVKNGVSKIWEKAQNYEIEFPIYENIKQAREYSQSALLGSTTEKLEAMLKSDLATPSL